MADHPADALPEDSARVFLSYSRKDRERAQTIADVLRERHFGVFRDTDDILPTEEWRGRLEQLIGEADTVVFLLSPHSVASEVCAWEVELASSLDKRIAPIVIDEVDTAEIPPLLARLNFIFCTERDRFQDAVDSLVSALNTDIDWIREHTRLAAIASRWENAGRPSRLLLRGQDIADAENWRDSRPADAPTVTTVHATFISESRRAASRRQRLTVAFSVAGTLFALGLAGFAYLQREAAIENERLAVRNEARAVEAQARAERERDAARINQSKLLTRFAAAELRKGLPVEAALLALEALPDARSREPARRDRPLVDEPQVLLREADRAMAEAAILIRLEGAVNRMALSSDRRFLVAQSGDAGEVAIYDRVERGPARRFEDNALRVASGQPSFRLDGSEVAIAGADGAVWLLPTAPARTPRRIEVSENGLRDVAFIDGDRALLAVGSDERVFRVGLAGGGVEYEVPGATIAVSRERGRFAATLNGRVHLHDAASGSVIAALDRTLEGAVNYPNRMSFSPDGRWLAVSSDLFTWVLDGRTLGYVGNTGKRKLSQLAIGFSPDGEWMHVAAADGEAIIYDVAAKKVVSRHKKQRGWIFDLVYGHTRDIVASASNAGQVQVWSPIGNAVLAELRGHAGGVLRVEIVDGGEAALSASEDGTVRRWRLPGPAEGRPTLVDEFREAPVYSRDGTRVALSGAGVFEMETGRVIRRDGPSHTGPRFVEFSDDGALLLALAQGPDSSDYADVCLHDAGTGARLRCMLDRTTGNIWSADMDGSARTIAADVVGNGQSQIVSFDAATGRELGRLDSRRGALGEPTVSADGERIFIRETNGPIRVYDRTLAEEVGDPIAATHDSPLRRVYLPGRGQVLLVWAKGHAEARDLTTGERMAQYRFDPSSSPAIVPSPSEQLLATRTRRGGLAVWRTGSGEVLATVEPIGPDPLEQPVFSADERYVMASAGATTAVWELASGREVDRFEMDFGGSHPSVFAKGFSADGTQVVTWSWEGPKRWPFRRDPNAVVAAVQERIPRCLGPEQRRRFSLPAEPPRWCITGSGREGETDAAKWQPKWPYHTDAWRDWLLARDRGDEAAAPQ